MLRAISIYQIKADQKGIDLFEVKSANNQNIPDFEKQIFPKYKDDIISGVRSQVHLIDKKQNTIFPIYYFIYMPEAKSKLYVVAANEEIAKQGLYYLFTNIEHADLRPIDTGVTLEKIMGTPGTYTEINAQVEALLEKSAKVSNAMRHTLFAAHQRGQRFEEAKDAADALEKGSDTFKLSTIELRDKSKCCSYSPI